ncbi:MAG: UDP-N-acetylmuramoyl-L-alanyl-D-glutamate--2,6-diaminopimelate ligase [Armatimonadetes bacterium]|nr:UDP-N-acetylmuramoyl-L-alanyl-D-glutamate--2,6-diaminopimelate ligase [Armatimonadota bacterium]
MDNLTERWAQTRRLAADKPITGVTADSRQVEPGNLFVAVAGHIADGHDFIAEAIQRGARAIVFEKENYAEVIPDGVSAVRVADSRRAAAEIAAQFWDYPSDDLVLVGITGTNGKTTTAFLVDSIFRAAGASTGLLSTPARFVCGQRLAANLTTPSSAELQELLAQMREAGATHVTMEVSSHGLAQQRTWMCKFDAAIFTNLTQDHLDFHTDLDDYFAAKLRLFTDYVELAGPNKAMVAAVNADDAFGERIIQQTPARTVTYGLDETAQVSASRTRVSTNGIDFMLALPDHKPTAVKLNLMGSFNLYNALAAAACTWGLGVEPETIVTGLEQLDGVPGRFERIDEGQDFTVIVDYAHTPDALENILQAARRLAPARLLCVFGCGGDRDRGKRPQMGQIATSLSDFTVITSDNPRSEDPEAIIDQIRTGAVGDSYIIQPDRRRAIFMAVQRCQPGDILVIAGKGHETYQIIGDQRVPFDDGEVAREAIIQVCGEA